MPVTPAIGELDVSVTTSTHLHVCIPPQRHTILFIYSIVLLIQLNEEMYLQKQHTEDWRDG